MPRLLGVDIPSEKKTIYSLQYLYGVGQRVARELCHKAGVDPDVLYESLAKGSANSFVLQNHVRKHAMVGDFREGMFSIDYEMKDLGLALETADGVALPQQFASLAYQTYQQARAIGLAKSYYPAVFKVVERLAGVEVRTGAAKKARKKPPAISRT